jgi:endonuclease YncB( thermonuclease family)
MEKVLERAGYETLRDQVVQVLQAGKERAQRAVEEETLRTYHEIGCLLSNYALDNKERADYGAQTVTRLAQEVEIGQTLLYQTLAFYRLEPILHTRVKLGWSHYRILLRAPSLEAQRYYRAGVETHGWSVRELEAQIKAGAFEIVAADSTAGEKVGKYRGLGALRGYIYSYRLAAIPGASALRVDVGFGIYLDLGLAGLTAARTGQLVVSKKDAGTYGFEAVAGRKAAYYSYRARVLSVIDGDTLWLDVDCGFGVWTKQKVRLRGIDAPELPTAEGVRAKDFVVQALGAVSFVVVTTTKPDKYDRYLADVFYLPNEEDGQTVLEDGVFLNRALHEAGLVSWFVRDGV